MKNNFGEWVSVKDRLPEEEKEYLVTDGSDWDTTIFHLESKTWDRYDNLRWFSHSSITHWMELPELPK